MQGFKIPLTLFTHSVTKLRILLQTNNGKYIQHISYFGLHAYPLMLLKHGMEHSLEMLDLWLIS